MLSALRLLEKSMHFLPASRYRSLRCPWRSLRSVSTMFSCDRMLSSVSSHTASITEALQLRRYRLQSAPGHWLETWMSVVTNPGQASFSSEDGMATTDGFLFRAVAAAQPEPDRIRWATRCTGWVPAASMPVDLRVPIFAIWLRCKFKRSVLGLRLGSLHFQITQS